MEGGSTGGYFAIRMKSDIIYETEYKGALTQEKYCISPGLYCGLILLTSVENAERGVEVSQVPGLGADPGPDCTVQSVSPVSFKNQASNKRDRFQTCPYIGTRSCPA